MQNKPLISVIVPVYNTEQYLKKCVNSLLNQTYTNLEIILINDGSTDSSGKMCDDYAEMDSRIKVIHKSNAGVSAARNSGIDVALGEFLMFVDSDDYVEKKMLDLLYKKTAPDIDLIISSAKKLGCNCETEYTIPDKKIPIENLFVEFINNLFSRSLLFVPWCKMYRRELIKKENIRFNEKMSYGEDLYFNMDYLCKARKAAICTSEILYFYTEVNRESLTNKYKFNYYLNEKMIYDKLFKTANFLNCGNDILIRIKKEYFTAIIANLINIVALGDKEESLKYMKLVKNDKDFNEHFNLFKKKKKSLLIALLIKYRMYNLLYFLLFIRQFLLTIK